MRGATQPLARAELIGVGVVAAVAGTLDALSASDGWNAREDCMHL